MEAVYEGGVRHFICGMAEGCDIFFGEAVAALRRSRPDVTLEAAVPCPEQDLRWSAGSTERYDRLLSECDKLTVVSPRYSPECMMAPQPLYGGPLRRRHRRLQRLARRHLQHPALRGAVRA